MARQPRRAIVTRARSIERGAFRGKSATTTDLQTLAELLASRAAGAGAAIYLLGGPGEQNGNQPRCQSACLVARAGSLAAPSTGVTNLARRVADLRPGHGSVLPWSFEEGSLAVPIWRGEERLGALVVRRKSAEVPGEDWLSEVRDAAGLVAGLVAGQQLEREAERRKAELRALEEIGGVVERATTTEVVLEGIFDASARALRCDTASLFAVDERGESLQMIAGRNIPAEVLQTSHFRMGEGVAGWVAAQNRPVIVPDVAHDPRYRFPDSGLDGPRSLLVVPLRLGGKVIATLCFARRGSDAFSRQDLELAGRIAVYAAQALEHARLSKLQDRAESLCRRFETLSAISHDIRTSLMHVKLAAKLAQHHPCEAQRNSLLAQIVQKVDQISALINASLESSRLHSELMKLRVAPVPLRKLVDDMLGDFAPKLGPSHRVEVNVPPDLVVYADSTQLWRVLANLLDNAIKYSPDGGAIGISAEVTGEGTLVSVRDEGVGIDDKHLGHVFDQFYRAPGPAEVPGFGLGLYTCLQIVKAHGGTIRVDSMPGQGSTFSFVVPGRRADDEPPAAGDEQPAGRATPGDAWMREPSGEQGLAPTASPASN